MRVTSDVVLRCAVLCCAAQSLDPDSTEQESFLSADMSISCQSARYSAGVAWASIMLLVFPVLLPALALWRLYTLKDLLAIGDQPGGGEEDAARAQSLRPVEFLVSPYRPECWFWEPVEQLRKVFLCGWLVVFDHGTTLQAVVGGLCCLLFIKARSVFSPYRDRGAALTAEYSLWALFFCYYIALLLRDESFAASRSGDLDTALLVLVVGGVLLEGVPTQWWLAVAAAVPALRTSDDTAKITLSERERRGRHFADLLAKEQQQEDLQELPEIAAGDGPQSMSWRRGGDKYLEKDQQEGSLRAKAAGMAGSCSGSRKVHPHPLRDEEGGEALQENDMDHCQDPYVAGALDDDDDDDDDEDDDDNVLMC